MFFQKQKSSHLVLGMVLGSIVGMAAAGTFCTVNSKDLTKKLMREMNGIKRAVTETVGQLF